MKRIRLYALSALLICGLFLAKQGKAEDSAGAYEPKARSYETFITAYNADGNTIPANSVVILAVDAGQTSTGNYAGTLGAYVRSTTTTDSIFAIGVADEDIPSTRMGRICVKGPHKVAMANNMSGQSTGAILSTSTTQYKGGVYATADGTAGGQLGYMLSTTATTDTGDASNTFWFYINPRFHK